jgi:hypothetical protein
VATVVLLGVVLVLLTLVARPPTRWTQRDVGRLAAVGRAMALAAESGGAATFSLGTAGVARATSALDRLQTLAALPILGIVAGAAARSGVPLRVSTNDPVAAQMADRVLDEAHGRTETRERRDRSTTDYLGEGRATAASAAMARASLPAVSPAAVFVAGSLSEEGLLLLDASARHAASTSFGTADASQATSVLLTGEGTLVGPELFAATSDVRGGSDRTAVTATNRIVLAAAAVIVIGSMAAGLAGVDVAAALVGS